MPTKLKPGKKEEKKSEKEKDASKQKKIFIDKKLKIIDEWL